MINLQKSKLNITARISVRSAQSRKYYERSFEFDSLTFDKNQMVCNVKFESAELVRLDNFLKEYSCEEFYFEAPAGNLFFTFRRSEHTIEGTVKFVVFKEEKISYPEKQKV